MIHAKTGVALLAPLLALALLSACNSNDTQSPFGPTPTPTPPIVEPTPVAVFDGDTSAFVVFLCDQPLDGEPLEVNDGAVVFTDTSGVTEPVMVSNCP